MARLPEKFIETINNCGASQFDGLIDALQSSQPVVSVRFNALRHISAPAEATDRVGWCDTGIYLPERFPFTFDPAMHQGIYYVQDASSMFVGEAVRQALERFFPEGKPLDILDACAAPGGKTGCVAAAIPEGSLIVANEMSAQRCEVLAENICKSGYAHAVVTRADAARFGDAAPGQFDLIVLDAPCSGEGMMRKEPVASEQWSEGLVEECAAIQRHLAAELWKALRPGGVMVYSTCTFNRREDEDVAELIASFDGAEPFAPKLRPEWNIQPGIDTALPCMRFIPGKTRGEGLFMAMFHKRPDATARASQRIKEPRGITKAPTAVRKEASAWITGADEMEFIVTAPDQQLQAVDRRHLPTVWRLMAAGIPVQQCGIEIGELKGKDLVPSQGLALSCRLNEEAFPRHEVDADSALAFLRRESLTLEGDGIPRGYVLLTHNGRPLGFVKNLGRRANNLYPRRWRVVSAREPSDLAASLSNHKTSIEK